MEDDGFVEFDEMYFDNEVVLDEEFMNDKIFDGDGSLVCWLQIKTRVGFGRYPFSCNDIAEVDSLFQRVKFGLKS